IALLSVLVLFSFGAAFAAEPKPVVKINDTVLYEPDLHEVVERLVPSAMFHGGLTAKRIEKYRDQAIEIMIEEELLYQIAKK
ncbi:MAG: hypothetical protein GWN86_22170, partial [Desulfobacterales bacterium]|nr:hypothetical protein [Desulfobacterales bacterium]